MVEVIRDPQRHRNAAAQLGCGVILPVSSMPINAHADQSYPSLKLSAAHVIHYRVSSRRMKWER